MGHNTIAAGRDVKNYSDSLKALQLDNYLAIGQVHPACSCKLKWDSELCGNQSQYLNMVCQPLNCNKAAHLLGNSMRYEGSHSVLSSLI